MFQLIREQVLILIQETGCMQGSHTFHHLALITTLQLRAADRLLLSRTSPGLMIPRDAQGIRQEYRMLKKHKLLSSKKLKKKKLFDFIC